MPSDSSPPSRLRFGLVDVAAIAAVLLAAAGVVWSPKLSGAVAQATGAMVPVTVAVDVRGIPVADPEGLIAAAQRQGRVAIVIRNQPHGSVTVEEIIPLRRQLVALQPDGSVVTAPDPRDAFTNLDARFVLQGQGRRGEGGVVFGNQSIKVGAPVEIEGDTFRVSGTVTDIQLENS
ncbi:MAG: DUF4330 domain-containing protein [Cyanobacteria bacterium J06638_7]